MINKFIEIAVPEKEKSNTTLKGKLFEQLVQRVFELMQYTEIKTEITQNGTEIDLKATHKLNSQKIVAECKAYRSEKIKSSVLTSLIGKIGIFKYDYGYLFTTGSLSKDAEELFEEIKNGEHNKKFGIVRKESIIDTLVTNNTIKPCESLKINASISPYIVSYTLLVTKEAYYWAVEVRPNNMNIGNTIILFDALTGNEVVSKELIASISKTDNSFSEYNWLTQQEYVSDDSELQKELNNISKIMSGDNWFDLRPSRPVDFIGRADVIKGVIDFYSTVFDKKTDTRLYSILSPSGWGKSSFAIKLASEAQKKFKNKVYTFAVDVRTAISERYVELALLKLFQEMKRDGFIKTDCSKVVFDKIENFFYDETVKKALAELKSDGKVVVLFFDQFEEILTKKLFAGLFNSVKNLSFAVDGLKENIIIGFAWKTDLSIAVDHPAYQIWSNLGDRRLQFELTQFSEAESKKCLNRASAENLKLSPLLSRYLIEQCNGFPWLLKKFCYHIQKNLSSTEDQEKFLTESLNIKTLFDKDTEGLNEFELQCLREIAKNSPADYVDVTASNEEAVLKKLIDARLIIRRGTKLTLYWDIFKDYLLNNLIPDIGVRVIPICTYSFFYETIQLLSNEGGLNIKELADKLEKTEKTMYNMIVDLGLFDLISKDGDKFLLKNSDVAVNVESVKSIFEKHIILNSLKKIDDEVTYEMFLDAFYENYSFNEKTSAVYINKLLKWFKDLKLIEVDGAEKTKPTVGVAFYAYAVTHKDVSKFIKKVKTGETKRKQLTSRKDMDCVLFLSHLGCIEFEKGTLSRIDSMAEIVSKIKEKDIFIKAEEFIKGQYTCSITCLGDYLKNSFNADWKSGTAKRYATLINTWYKYIRDLGSSKKQISIFELTGDEE